MSTRVDQRNPSPIQFIDTAKELVAHTWRYLIKFPKTSRFIFQTKLNDLAMEVYEYVVKANTIYTRKDNINDIEAKRQLINKSLGALNSFEGFLSIAQVNHKTEITNYGWEQWGILIDKERILLTGLLKSLNN